MVEEQKRIDSNLIRMAWYMRGGIQLEVLMNMSFRNIELISSLIDENLETTKKTKLPFF